MADARRALGAREGVAEWLGRFPETLRYNPNRRGIVPGLRSESGEAYAAEAVLTALRAEVAEPARERVGVSR